MLEIIGDRTLVEKNPYEQANIKKLHFLPFYNFEDGFYGGRVKYVAELKESDLFLLVSPTLETVDVARFVKEETQEEPKSKETFVCKKCNKEFEGRGNFLTHTRACK